MLLSPYAHHIDVILQLFIAVSWLRKLPYCPSCLRHEHHHAISSILFESCASMCLCCNSECMVSRKGRPNCLHNANCYEFRLVCLSKTVSFTSSALTAFNQGNMAIMSSFYLTYLISKATFATSTRCWSTQHARTIIHFYTCGHTDDTSERICRPIKHEPRLIQTSKAVFNQWSYISPIIQAALFSKLVLCTSLATWKVLLYSSTRQYTALNLDSSMFVSSRQLDCRAYK